MNECDFIPDYYREQSAFRRSVRVRISGIGVILCIMVLWCVAHGHRLAGAEAMQGEISLQLEQVETNVAKKRTMDIQLAELRDRQRLIEKLSGRASLVLVFSEISRRQPEMVVLTDVSVDCSSLAAYTKQAAVPPVSGMPASVQPEGVKPEASPKPPAMQARLKLSGIAASLPDVIQFAAALEKSPLFDRVTMKVDDSTVWAGRSAERFELTCKLVPQGGRRP